MFSRADRGLLSSNPSPSFQQSRGGRGGGGRGRGGRGGGRCGRGGGDRSSRRESYVRNSITPGAKPPSPASTEEPKTVAVILSARVSYCDFHIWVYAIKLDGGNTDSKLQPFICLGDGLPTMMSFIILDSVLFMFGGLFTNTVKYVIDWQTLMYTYPLTRPFTPNSFNKELLKQGPDMKAPKVAPMSIAVCGKILVFSDCLSDDRKPNFELYDPTTCSWSQLPEPLKSYASYPPRIIGVDGVCLRDSTLYVLISSSFYAFDFHPSSSCNTWERAFFADPHPYPRMVGISVDNYFLSPFYGFDLTIPSGMLHKFPVLHGDEPRDLLALVRGNLDIIYLGKVTLGDFRMCSVRAGFREDSFGKDAELPYLLLDVFRCFTSQSRQLKIIREKQFTFLLSKILCDSLDFAVAFAL